MTAELFGRNLVKDKSHIEGREGRCKVDDDYAEGVDCQGVRGCNLVHIDPSGVFCHAPTLHQNCIAQKVEV